MNTASNGPSVAGAPAASRALNGYPRADTLGAMSSLTAVRDWAARASLAGQPAIAAALAAQSARLAAARTVGQMLAGQSAAVSALAGQRIGVSAAALGVGDLVRAASGLSRIDALSALRGPGMGKPMAGLAAVNGAGVLGRAVNANLTAVHRDWARSLAPAVGASALTLPGLAQVRDARTVAQYETAADRFLDAADARASLLGEPREVDAVLTVVDRAVVAPVVTAGPGSAELSVVLTRDDVAAAVYDGTTELRAQLAEVIAKMGARSPAKASRAELVRWAVMFVLTVLGLFKDP